MKKASVLSAVLAVLLIIGEGCAEHACGEGYNEVVAINLEMAPSPEDAECMAEARKWVRKIEKFYAASDRMALDKLNLAIMLAKIGDRDAAIKIFDRAVKEAPSVRRGKPGERDGYGALLEGIAEAQARAGLYDLARKTAEQARTHKDNALILIRNIAVDAGDWDMAKEFCRNGDYSYVAVSEAKAGRFEDAKKTAALMIKDNAYGAVMALAKIALLEAKAGRANEAKKTLAQAEKNLPENTEQQRSAFFVAALRVEVELCMYKAAEARLANIKGEYYKIPALILVAETKFKSGDKKGAATLLAQAKDIAQKAQAVAHPIDWLCKVAKGQAEVGDTLSAVKTYNEIWALAEKHNDITGFWNIIKSAAQAGLYPQAKEYAMRLEGAVGAALMTVATVQAEAGLYEEAEKTADEAVKAGKGVLGNPDSTDRFLGEMAYIQVGKGEFDLACETLKSISEQNLYDLERVIDITLDAGEIRHVKCLLKILQKCDPQKTTWQEARILARLGDYKRLVARYKTIEGGSLVFCLGAAEGYLKRIEDKQDASGKN